MFVELKRGMICLMLTGIGQKAPDEDKTAILEQGTPVKIVDIVEPDCPSMLSGECHAPCKGACCPRTVIVEDCNGKQWTVKPDIEDGDFPLIVLDNGDAEMLLAREDWKKYKIAEWTDEGIKSKYMGPMGVMIGVMSMAAAKDIPGFWGLVISIVSGLVALYCAAMFIVGNKYADKPLPYGQVLFYRNYVRNKKALEVLLENML